MLDKKTVLDEIFGDDPMGILVVRPKASLARNADERLIASFQEINDFIDENGKEPTANMANISEYQLYSRLKGFRDDLEKMLSLKSEDKHNLFDIEEPKEEAEPVEINSIDDIFGDDSLDILGNDDSEGLFDFKHTPKDYERASTDFVARRKPCKDFDKYEGLFKSIHRDLSSGKRKLVDFKEDNLRKGDFYVHNGIMMLLEEVSITQTEQSFNTGKRTRKDGRTKCIFENGTVSNMLYRSVAKAMYANGKVVTQNIDKVNEDFQKKFSNVTDEDKESGYIYVLKSLSTDKDISSIKNLYKIGYSTTSVQERIKNAEKEPTYLMAPVKEVTSWQAYNMNTQKLEQLLHNFFGNSCLNIDVFDKKGRRHTPQEWFIAPLQVIEQAVELIVSGGIVEYRYDGGDEVILKK